VQDLALVEHLEIAFSPGLTVITGESGAGKSILLAALSLVLGERASSELLRPGASRLDVSAEFDISLTPGLRDQIATLELVDDDHPGTCLLRRTMSADGRSKAFVNGIPVTLQVLRELAENLVDIHGQNENVRLARRDVQLTLLDDFALATTDREQVTEIWRSWQQVRRAAASLRASATQQADRIELLTYQLQELEGIESSDIESLFESHRRLAQVEHLLETVLATDNQLTELDTPGRLISALESLADTHPSLESAVAALKDAAALLDDARGHLRRYADVLEPDPERFATLGEQIELLHGLARKHKVAPKDLPARIKALTDELDNISADTEALEAAEAKARILETAFHGSAAALSNKRQLAAKQFAREVTRTLAGLGLAKVKLACAFSRVETETGIDAVELLVTTNPKYPPGPLGKIASGGELARINLAIAVTAAERTALPCLVLDEADVGVGGNLADTVGRLLRRLGAHTQVICVTHAPQVAALGNQHLCVVKTDAEDTTILVLDPSARREEIARMLAGAEVSDKTRQYADALLAEAR
jgi:DNA repair protein RecN (Recombination protein N)